MQKVYYLVDKNVLPSVFEKVVEAKKLLYSKKCQTVNDAVRIVGISRSAFYKYKDSVSVFVDNKSGYILNLNILLSDNVGNLSCLLSLLSDLGASILTINQSIPVNDIAPLTISLSVKDMKCSVDQLVDNIKKTCGVLNVDILSEN